MGAVESTHNSHHHHKSIKGKIGKTYEEDGVVVLSDEELHHTWQHYDENKNDRLDEHELDAMIKDLIEHTITNEVERNKVKASINSKGDFVKSLMIQLDHDKDGIVTFPDFVKSYHKIMEQYLKSH